MTEEEAREIVERYEALVRQVLTHSGHGEGHDFLVDYPVEICGRQLVVRENIEGDRWSLRRAEMHFS